LADIFLSYSREDQTTARRFAAGFERAGFSVWWDQTLNAGEAYDEVTEKALEEARAVVVLWSRNSVASRWVRAEATQADRSGTLVPAMIEDCKRPIMFELKQTADLSNWSGDPNDKTWLAYVASVRRFVEKDAVGTDATPPIPSPPVPGRSRWISPAVVAIGVTALLFAGAVLWEMNRSSNDTTSQPATAAANVPGAAATDVSLAVLPFLNMSSDPEQEHFSDGLAEELLNQLSQVPGLRVVGRASSFTFKGKVEDPKHIGETLGVNHLLAGSVSKAANRVRINAQLINPADGTQLWSESYERALDDIFAIQEEIARTVVGQLQLRLGAAGQNANGTKNVAAFEAFLAGRSLLGSYSAESAEAARSHLERAVLLDPSYISAWLWLIEACMRPDPGLSRPREEMSRRMEEAIDRVVALAPGKPEASFALSYRAAQGHDLVTLERLLRESLLIPEGAGVSARGRYNGFLGAVGDVARTLDDVAQRRADDPLNTFGRTNSLLTYELAGEFERADAESSQILQLPGGRTLMLLGNAFTRALGQRDSAKIDAAITAFESAGTAAPLMRLLLTDPVAARRELRQRLNDPKGQPNYSSIASMAAYLGDKELALQALQGVRREGSYFSNWAFQVWRPVFSDVRRDPGFKKLARDMGLVEYWRTSGNWGDFCKPVGRDDFECH
jgi:TolB-like protein